MNDRRNAFEEPPRPVPKPVGLITRYQSASRVDDAQPVLSQRTGQEVRV